MTTKKKILFVVEGHREEEELKRNILHHLNLNVEDCDIVMYGTSIHELSCLLAKPEHEEMSLTAILIKRNLIKVDTNVQLDSTFSSVYLVFDFDPQYQKYNEIELINLSKRFNNETEDGMLLLNYPMFESLFDIEDINNLELFLKKKTSLVTSNEYKKIVKARTFFKSYSGNVYKHIDDKETFKKIAYFNLKKYQYIMKLNSYTGLNQEELLKKQIKELSTMNEFYIINTLSLLYFDYND